MRLTPKRAVWIGLALAAALWGVWGRPGSPGTASVLYVVDGDTLKVRAGEGPEGVRLIGIDAPESRDNPKAKRDVKRTRQGLREILALGQRSKQFVQELVRPGDRVRLEFDAERRDRYGRLLACRTAGCSTSSSSPRATPIRSPSRPT
jgi:endonuclease YncB( thermonuclease family)